MASEEGVSLSRLIDTLRACYMTRRLSLFCRYLWQFHVGIGNAGPLETAAIPAGLPVG
jgi:hypothetical protein